MALKSKLFIAHVSIFSISVVLVMSILIVAHKQKSDGLIINLAGRQRMLTQKISKEILGLAYHIKIKGQTHKGLEQSLLKSITIFDSTLNALISSGNAPITLDPDGPKKWIPPAKGEALSQLKKVQSMWKIFKENIEKVRNEMDENALENILNTNIPLLKEMNKAVSILQKQAEAKVFLLKIISISGLIIGIIIIWGIGLWIRKSFIEPIVSLAEFAEEIKLEYSDGENGEEDTIKEKNEIVLLNIAMHNMVEKLRKEISNAKEASKQSKQMAKEAEEARKKAEESMIIAQKNEQALREAAQEIDKVSKQIVSSSKQLSLQADQVTEGAEIQKQRVVETATAMEEMNATVLEVAKNAASAAESAEEAKTRAEKGAMVVDDAVAAINKINELTEKLKDNMEILKEKANSISQVMTVISDIADQTNLLALNAAIEAARAGEAGRGFAVVADEVRKLAEKTMMATKEVGEAINEIQEEVKRDVEEMNNVAQSVAKGTELSQESKVALEEIVELVNSIADQIRAIATASEEQSATSEEITRTISDISEISDSTANNIEDMRNNIQEFVLMAGELKQLVEKLVKK